MVLFFTILLCISIGGIVSLLVVKRWELSTGNMLLASARPGFSRTSHRFMIWIERVLPHLVTELIRHGIRKGLTFAHRTAAHGLLWAEQTLERVLATLRGVTEQPKSSKEASAFLREIAEHKRQLATTKQTQSISDESVSEIVEKRTLIQ